MTYTPPIFFNEFWMLRDTLIPVNETLSEVQIALDLHQMALWKFTIYSQMEKSFQMQVAFPSPTPAYSVMHQFCGVAVLNSPMSKHCEFLCRGGMVLMGSRHATEVCNERGMAADT